MSIFDIFRIGRFKEEIRQLKEENDKLKQREYTIDQLQYLNIKDEIANLTKQKGFLEIDVITLQKKVDELKKKVVILEEEELMQSFGFYTSIYNLGSSELYKERLNFLRNEQTNMVKSKTAVTYNDNWTLNGSLSEGRKLTNDTIKMVLRAFNNECDASISKVKYNNIDSIKKKITLAWETLNKLNTRNQVAIREEYLNLKFAELQTVYEYQKKLEEEKEEQRIIRERMRDEEEAMREIEKLEEKLEKEEKHFKKALDDLQIKYEKASTEEKAKLEQKIKEMEEKLRLLEKDKSDVENRKQNTRAGYVYIISNIGSFGEDVYKIGLTRRLEPMERVRELGTASVPFNFDVHAMIFSEDAPTLETALHKHFENVKINKVNRFKEFFKVSLQDIENVVKEKHNKVVEFTKIAEAEEYRQSLMMQKTNKEYL